MTGSNLGDLGARTPGAELQGAQGPPVDNSRSRLLQLHGSLLGLVFSFLEPADRTACVRRLHEPTDMVRFSKPADRVYKCVASANRLGVWINCSSQQAWSDFWSECE
eukprot:394304-Pelagomonas_calceolata.AAC.1